MNLHHHEQANTTTTAAAEELEMLDLGPTARYETRALLGLNPPGSDTAPTFPEDGRVLHPNIELEVSELYEGREIVFMYRSLMFLSTLHHLCANPLFLSYFSFLSLTPPPPPPPVLPFFAFPC